MGEAERVCYLDDHMHLTDCWTPVNQHFFFFNSLPDLCCQMSADTETHCQWTNAIRASADLSLTARTKEQASQLRLKEGCHSGEAGFRDPLALQRALILIRFTFLAVIIDEAVWSEDTRQA